MKPSTNLQADLDSRREVLVRDPLETGQVFMRPGNRLIVDAPLTVHTSRQQPGINVYAVSGCTIEGSGGIDVPARADEEEAGQWGHAIAVYEGRDTVIRGLKLSSGCGDCISISSGLFYSSDHREPSRGTVIENVVTKKAYRNCISLADFEGLDIRDSQLLGATGEATSTVAGAGIAMEVNPHGPKVQKDLCLDNVLIDQCAGYGLQLQMYYRPAAVDITALGCEIHGGARPAVSFQRQPAEPGTVWADFWDCNIYSGRDRAVHATELGGARIVFYGGEIHHGGKPPTDGTIHCYAHKDVSELEFGNLFFDRMRFPNDGRVVLSSGEPWPGVQGWLLWDGPTERVGKTGLLMIGD